MEITINSEKIYEDKLKDLFEKALPKLIEDFKIAVIEYNENEYSSFHEYCTEEVENILFKNVIVPLSKFLAENVEIKKVITIKE